MAVTMSGFMTGRLLISSTMLRTTRFDLESPMAATVPTTVETAVAITATRTVYQMLWSMVRSWNMFSYQRREKPVKLVRDFESLKEKRTT